MTRLSYYQVAQLAYDAGWREPDLSDAVAIAFAESAGNPDAIGDVRLENSTWGPSVGLWQIRSLNVERGTGGIRDEKCNRNPRTNAIHAHAIFQSARGFFPWSTWTSHAYKTYWPTRAMRSGNCWGPDSCRATSCSPTPCSTGPMSPPVSDTWTARRTGGSAPSRGST